MLEFRKITKFWMLTLGVFKVAGFLTRETIKKNHVVELVSTTLRFASSEHSSIEEKKGETALVWLRTSLRVNDNHALSCGAQMGPDGLAILYTWSRDSVIPQTPSAVFECAAGHALRESLRSLKHNLLVLHTRQDDVVHKVSGVINEIQPTSLIIDSHEYPGDAEQLRNLFPNLNIVQIKDQNALLHPFSKTRYVLGRSRGGGRILRWATFLSGLQKEEFETPLPAPLSLPPPISVESCTESLPEPTSAGEWAKNLLEYWGDISEKEALLRAKNASISGTITKENQHHLGNIERIPSDTKLSPYLRWGMISPRQAATAGVRKRDLLWRDWSHICYHRVLQPLKRGDPVIQLLDGCYITKEDDTSKNATDVRNWDEESKFRAWCVGNTGSPLVDAGMRQLWLEGWIPRSIRLLVASCLVEGLGVDWRKGRDWFEYTLIDHDPAINEMMWQNAGLCGVDPFYRGLKWEKSDPQYADYINYFLNQKLSWPSNLEKYSKKGSLHSDCIELAEPRRKVLSEKGVYRAVSQVINSGVRVAWPGSNKGDTVADGEVLGVGRTPLNKLSFKMKQDV